ncbi:hypothetical protein [Paenibacillus chitinolyticus]|uniref:hypothetical protein n=1 Tax=Paenibacillus chitinolyticus TaxID=79263 RepID=UPI003558870D
MEREKDALVRHISRSHLELAKILHYKSEVAAHMAGLIGQIPDKNPAFADNETLLSQSVNVTRNVTSYLSSLADLEEALATNLGLVVKELESGEGNE